MGGNAAGQVIDDGSASPSQSYVASRWTRCARLPLNVGRVKARPLAARFTYPLLRSGSLLARIPFDSQKWLIDLRRRAQSDLIFRYLIRVTTKLYASHAP